MPFRKVFPAAVMLVIAGCGTIPNITVSYYFPRAKTQFAVSQTVGCSPKVNGKHRILRSVISVIPTTINSADLNWKNAAGSAKQGHIDYRAFRGTFSDADATVTLTPDGRLVSINATSGGVGDAVLKNAIMVAGAVALTGPSHAAPFVETVEDRSCALVDKFSIVDGAVEGKSVSFITLNYNLTITYDAHIGAAPTIAVDEDSSPGYNDQHQELSSIVLVPDAPSKPTYDALKEVLGDRMETTLKVTTKKDDLRVLTATTPTTVSPADGVPLELNKVAVVELEIDGHAGDMFQSSRIWAGGVPIPMRDTYQVPIPSPPMFGKTAFGIGLSDNGMVTSLHYGETNGSPDATDSASQIANLLKPKTSEERANDLKAQADLIAQQQRLIACEVSPSTCK